MFPLQATILAYRQNVVSLNLSYRYYFGRCSSALADLVSHRYYLTIPIDCLTFFSPFIDVTRFSLSTVSFLTQLNSGIHCLKNAFL